MSPATTEQERTDVCLQEGWLGKWNRALLGALAEMNSRRVLEFAIAKGRTVDEISRECGVPLSSCYRLVKEFTEEGLMITERIVITPEGKRYAVYRTTFRSVEVEVEPNGTTVKGVENEDVRDKVHARWLSMAYAPRPPAESETGAALPVPEPRVRSRPR